MRKIQKNKIWLAVLVLILVILAAASALLIIYRLNSVTHRDRANANKIKRPKTAVVPLLDKAAYDRKLEQIANNPARLSAADSSGARLSAESSPPTATGSAPTVQTPLWPVKTAYPDVGAILPFNRIVAYYGNFYSKDMGVLGEYPEDQMLNMLNTEVQKWQKADPATPVIPAIHYIAVVARGGPGKDGEYRARMPDSQIQKAIALAQKINGLVFLDVQVGRSTVEAELPLLAKYLKNPIVHLGIDPEFAVGPNGIPGQTIGTLDAKDINFAVGFLAQIVKDNNLTPKILIVHRFTEHMVTNYQQIKPLPEVQIVMNMDGFGAQANKLNTYKQYIYKEPVQFTGFKLFYKNDAQRGSLLSPEDLLKLTPIPLYIQFQ